jgi:hypothetical protein
VAVASPQEEFMRVWFITCAVVTATMSTGGVASAQTGDAPAIRQEIDRLRSEFAARLAALEARLAVLAAGQPSPDTAATGAPAPSGAAGQPPNAAVPPGVEAGGGPSGTLPVYGGAAASKAFNPDIAVVGDFLGAVGRNRVNPQPALEMHESEASFQAIVDPYARADFFVAFGEEGVELEEGFLTFPAVPGGLLVKVGKQRAAFGKVNTLHNHAMPWADRPLVTGNLVGGEEGLGDAGISVARLIPNPWVFLEATGQIFRGESGDLFSASRRGDVSYVGRLRGYHDLTEDTNIDLGASYARGHNASGVVEEVDAGRFRTRLTGIDATVRWRPLRRSIYRSFIGRSELIWSRREQPAAALPGVLTRELQKSFGYYISGDFQVARRWFAGARYDSSAHATAAALRDTGHSLVLTYWPSEFSQIRGQYRRTNYAAAETANELLFQFLFSIGAHGAHPF